MSFHSLGTRRETEVISIVNWDWDWDCSKTLCRKQLDACEWRGSEQQGQLSVLQEKLGTGREGGHQEAAREVAAREAAREVAALRAELQETKGNLEASKGEVKELQEERRGLQAEVRLMLLPSLSTPAPARVSAPAQHELSV